MKDQTVKSEYSGVVLKGAAAKCYIALRERRANEDKAADQLKADIKRKAADLRTAAELKAADKYTTAPERRAAAVKYRAEARQRARDYKWKIERRAMDSNNDLCKKSEIAAERKIDALLLEAIDEQTGSEGHLAAYIRALSEKLSDLRHHLGT